MVAWVGHRFTDSPPDLVSGALGWGLPTAAQVTSSISSRKADRDVSQDGAEVPGSVDAVQQELAKMRERMAVIKQEAAVEVDRKWVSPWRTQDVFDLKVKTRLTANQEYRTLQNRVRDVEAGLAAHSDTAGESD